ncbi:hypothetical protein [Rhizobium hainanense]|uniref:Uncharacterized protein n=1 Tax=Rhizobium hainanense TaxID=52131 RepID=A0A1C3W9J1_9HYPH|nr:hypothetical protein [Rhizobium hainanense]SCB36680.1 hypothetical protein GA0061100_113126 [Rhizobium hainanense]
MTDDGDKKKPILAPSKDHPGDRLRAVATGIAGLAPGGGFVTALIDDLVPTGEERARTDWEASISERTNEHGARLDEHDAQINPKETIDGVVAALAAALAQACPDGLGHEVYEPDEIYALFSDIPQSEIEDAVWELDALGLISVTHLMGPIAWRLRLESVFYEQLDHQVMGWATAQDAAELAQIILDTDETRAEALHENTGWSKRRFNPAFRRVLEEIGEGRISREVQPEYVARYFALMQEDRVRLKRMIRSQHNQ